MTTMTSPPVTAAGLINTFGVNYTQNVDDVTSEMQYLGITNMRLFTAYYPWTDLAMAQNGIKFDFELDVGGSLTTSDLQSKFASIDQLGQAVPGAVAAVEGANEINNWPVTYNGVGGLQGAVNLQQAIYSMAHSDPDLPQVKVYYFTGYNLAGNGPDPSTTPGLADYDAAHPYPWGGPPPASVVNPSIALTNEATPGPAVYTETGYSNSGSFDDNLGLQGAADYTLNLLLDSAADGVAKTYLYELQEEGGGFGLFDANWNPTPAATDIHNLTSILSDSGTVPNSASPIPFSVSGLPSSGRDMAVVKSTGATDILVWAEPQITSTSRGPTSNVTMNLGSTYQTVKVFDPTLGSQPIQTLSNVSNVKLGLTDHPLVVEVEPNGVTGSGSDSLVLRISEDAYQGDAQFTVKVDGTQVGGTLTTSALHASGDANVFVLAGKWGSGAHSVQIQFTNDAYGGSVATDRNLYVNSIGYDGTTYAGTAANLLSAGSHSFTVGGTTAAGTAPADALTLHLSEDAYNGNAQFVLTIDGKTISTPQDVVTLHSSRAWQDLTFAGNFGAGTHTVGVKFTNDAYGGSATTDRNLYVNGVDCNGTHYGSGVTSLYSSATATFTITTQH